MAPNWSKSCQFKFNPKFNSDLLIKTTICVFTLYEITKIWFPTIQSKAIRSFLFLILEMSDDKYQLSSNISQLIGLILLQCCWWHVNIKLIKADNENDWQRKCTDKTKTHWTQYDISNSTGSQKCNPYSQNLTRSPCP